jgi:L-lactate dehydrogenase complex protein LldE
VSGVAKRSKHPKKSTSIFAKTGHNGQPMKNVALFIPCFVDQLSPQVGIDMVRVLQRIGYTVEFPEAQTCCGQPAFNSGYWEQAQPLAQHFVEIFGKAQAVVCPSGSCATMVRTFYPELLARTPLSGDLSTLTARVYEFSEFLVKFAKVNDVGASFPHRVAYHDACHALRELHLKQEPRELLRHVRGLQLVEMPYCEECCGFGGTFATKFPMISSAMGETKAANVEAANAEYVTSTDPSCLMHIDGVLRLRKSPARTIHIASILAQTADSVAKTSTARVEKAAAPGSPAVPGRAR